ncbi:LytTR family DNA-binding domain-containing protein [Emticicia sp. BO119]|uniref:LytR/AlgR family response regulator transcription factor n=1 Tax=Emticicia sp. BO119 TaxID=2757768 RepID=UPI0015F0332A|nr:LytTR family DNA-binding domain-containing protein [Emticicia sp. BO119]MBA4852615.1 LytTR family transcriptional regulator [Emticicia sp. BO119]
MKTIRISKRDISPQDILYLESQGNYTMLYLNDNKKELSSRTLQIFEEKLKGYNFYRVNRSHIVNFSAIEWFDSGSKEINILLKSGEQFSISRRRRKLFSMMIL